MGMVRESGALVRNRCTIAHVLVCNTRWDKWETVKKANQLPPLFLFWIFCLLSLPLWVLGSSALYIGQAECKPASMIRLQKAIGPPMPNSNLDSISLSLTCLALQKFRNALQLFHFALCFKPQRRQSSNQSCHNTRCSKPRLFGCGGLDFIVESFPQSYEVIADSASSFAFLLGARDHTYFRQGPGAVFESVFHPSDRIPLVFGTAPVEQAVLFLPTGKKSRVYIKSLESRV